MSTGSHIVNMVIFFIIIIAPFYLATLGMSYGITLTITLVSDSARLCNFISVQKLTKKFDLK